MAATHRARTAWLTILLGLGAAPACRTVALDLENLRCENDRCLDGYDCHPETGMCVPAISVGCDDLVSYCPTMVATGDRCPSQGSFLPCALGAIDCSGGCRTCENGKWSECTPADCVLGLPGSCAACDDDCATEVQNAVATCDTESTPATCDYEECATNFFDADGDRSNGCECAPTNGGIDIPCNDVDEDCSGADATQTGTIANCAGCGDNCEALDNVLVVTCEASGCAISACDFGWADVDDEASTGCEAECLETNGGVEMCDGEDNDCNGEIDDLSESDVQTDCDNQFPDVFVSSWGCDLGCVVVECDPDYYDITGGAEDGCEYECYTSNGHVETCDDEDNDCNGETDDIIDPTADCNDIWWSPTAVTAFACTDGECVITGCTAGTVDYNTDPEDGCELECTESNGGIEICDDEDNDCNGVVDDAPAGAAGCTTYYRDSDNDTYGVAGDTQCLCRAGNPYRATRSGDCNDGAAGVNSGATEVCDSSNVDEDCDDHADDADTDGATGKTTYYPDVDVDMYGDASASGTAYCDPPAGLRTNHTDCDDDDSASRPGGTEVCDGNNNDCSSGVPLTEVDNDGDRYVECTGWNDTQGDQSTILGGGDCADGNAARNPGASEACDASNVDEDCDSQADDADTGGATGKTTYYPDVDADTYGDAASAGTAYCDPPAGLRTSNNDCNDHDGASHPGATEVCDGNDNDCSSGVPVAELDHDSDRYVECTGWNDTQGDQTTILGGSDCADTNAARNPGASEVCDASNLDEDCDSQADDADTGGATGKSTCYPDVDVDLHGDASASGTAYCDPPAGLRTSHDDCDDDDAASYTGATEVCDGNDNDCTGGIPATEIDNDGDLYVECSGWNDTQGDNVTILGGNDCADNNVDRNPGETEICNNLDDDCDTTIDDNPPVTNCRCTGGTSPAADETCGNGIDDDCNNIVDDGCCTAGTPYCDADGRTLHVCKVDGSGPDPAQDKTCGYVCFNNACVAPSTVTEAQMDACAASAPALTPAASTTVTFTSTGITCSADCGSGQTTIASTPGATDGDPVRVCVSTLNLTAGVSLQSDGTENSALILLVAGNATVAGSIVFNGDNGRASDGGGGSAGPGGSAGANPCSGNNCDGLSGGGTGGGGGGQREAGVPGGGGGGAGYGGTGGEGGNYSTFGGDSGGIAGSTYGSTAISPLQGGSGGGSGGDGGNPCVATGSGGGGGGAVQITARGTLTISGTVQANGGNGATQGSNSVCGAGGGGSGGAVLLEAPSVVLGGTLRVDGGTGGASTGTAGSGATGATINGGSGGTPDWGGGGGGGGAGGRIRVRSGSSTACSGASPAASCTSASF